jgi:hypothetical protein
MTFAFTLIYLWTLACLKLSQLCLYSRVFSLHLRYWIWLGTGVVIMWAIAFTFSFIFLCSPIKQQWSLERLGHCIDQILVLKSLILTNIFTDVFIFVLPIRSVWKLQMRKTEKVAVISCFALGAAYVSHLASQCPLSLLLATTISDNTHRCVIVGIARFWLIFVIDLIGNLTGTSLTTFMLCSIELMLAGLCVNIPMLRPFYLRWRTNHKMSQGGSQAFNQGTGGFKSIRSDPLADGQAPCNGHAPAHHTAWIELVSTPSQSQVVGRDMADTPARMIRSTTRSMMMTVGRSGSLLATSLLLFMFLRTGRWLRLMRFERF